MSFTQVRDFQMFIREIWKEHIPSIKLEIFLGMFRQDILAWLIVKTI